MFSLDQVGTVAQQLEGSLWSALKELAWPALVFGALATLTKGRGVFLWTRRRIGETRINLWLYFVDRVLTGPLMGIVLAALTGAISGLGLTLTGSDPWAALGFWATLATAILVGDFSDYWTHRLMHGRRLWPIHAVHHSDTEVNWLTQSRIHPINRLITQSCSICLLSVVGFPLWALAVGGFLRYCYSLLVHADVPWTFGPLGGILVSPAMHRWHHARDVSGAGSNFGFVFAVFDRAFGTYYLPGPCGVALGVNEPLGRSAAAMLLHPFRKMLVPLMRAPASREG